MAEDIDKPIVDDTERAAHNAAQIQKQADQDISGQPVAGNAAFADSVSALDALHAGIVEKKKEAANVDEEGKPIKPADKPADKPSDKSSDKVGESSGKPADKPAETPAGDPAAIEAARAKQESEQAAQAETRKVADELFKDAPSLPANASPKSATAFDGIKIRAAQEVARLKAELEKATAAAEDLRSKAGKALTPEIEQELESHREFRTRLDIESDPKFKTFDKSISEAHSFIYAQLKKSPAVTDEVVEDIKKLGGPENVNMEKIFTAVGDPMIRRLVEAKLADVELLKYNKDQAITSTKANVKQYLEERQKQWEQSGTAHNTKTKAELDGLMRRVPWLNEITPDEKATDKEAAKKAADQHNAYAKQMQGEIAQAMTDDSPGMRATLLVGMAQLFRLQASHEHLTKKHAAVEKSLEEANETIKKLKSSSISRLKDSGAPDGGQIPEPKKEGRIFTERSGDALDRIRDEKLRAAAAA